MAPGRAPPTVCPALVGWRRPGSRGVVASGLAWSLCVLGRVFRGIGWSPDAGLTGPGRAVTLVGDACLPCRIGTEMPGPWGLLPFRFSQAARRVKSGAGEGGTWESFSIALHC